MYILVMKQLITMCLIALGGFIFAKIFKVEDSQQKFLSKLLLYFINLLFQIIVSAATMAGMVFSAEEPDPVIVEFHSGFKTQLQNVLLANSITLTPGTITLFQEGDHFVIHCLKEQFAEGLETSTFVKLLKKIR